MSDKEKGAGTPADVPKACPACETVHRVFHEKPPWERGSEPPPTPGERKLLAAIFGSEPPAEPTRAEEKGCDNCLWLSLERERLQLELEATEGRADGLQGLLTTEAELTTTLTREIAALRERVEKLEKALDEIAMTTSYIVVHCGGGVQIAPDSDGPRIQGLSVTEVGSLIHRIGDLARAAIAPAEDAGR